LVGFADRSREESIHCAVHSWPQPPHRYSMVVRPPSARTRNALPRLRQCGQPDCRRSYGRERSANAARSLMRSQGASEVPDSHARAFAEPDCPHTKTALRELVRRAAAGAAKSLRLFVQDPVPQRNEPSSNVADIARLIPERADPAQRFVVAFFLLVRQPHPRRGV
jgi:hypothetical protein